MTSSSESQITRGKVRVECHRVVCDAEDQANDAIEVVRRGGIEPGAMGHSPLR